jgi:hypothetical protein
MAIVNRQNNLFAAEDWKIVYKAYSQINFQAYDFDTIRTALVEYIRINFPENFNDYVDSSEFIAIIEMLAYLSQSLAFRMDLNSRENFLETAERRDSVFKLARMLGYNPKRNLPASGLMKIIAVRTTEPLTDSQGNEINNVNIFWDDSNNSQSYEQFITILNSAMSSANRFTAPIKSGIVGGIPSELYQLNTPITSPIVYNFNITINGANKLFNVINPDFTDNGFFFERHPDPTNLFNIIYRNDSKGIASSNTGFFVMFKQGSLQFVDLNYTTAIPGRIEDVAVANINETDVYLQEINTAGFVLNKWEKIPNTVGQTLNYSSVSLGTRNLYAVENLNNGGVRLRFPDGNFGNIPFGIFRIWHRVSDPTRYIIQPEEARNLTATIPYEDRGGRTQALTITYRLERRVNNSLPAETLAAIKRRAPQVYYTQNRMVSAQDYNVFPLSQSSNITKLKAINRTHAGHSRYIDINDPTGTFQNLDTFARDAILFTETISTSESIIINNNTTSREVVVSILPEYFKKQSLNNFVYRNMRTKWSSYVSNKFIVSNLNIRWNPLPLKNESDTGFMTETFSSGTQSVMLNTDIRTRIFKESSFVKFVNPNDLSDYRWVRIVSISNNGALTSGLSTSVGSWQLSREVPADWVATEIIVSLRKLFTAAEASSIQAYIDDRKTFGLGYDVSQDIWYVIENKDLRKTGDFNVVSARNTSGQGLDDSWLVLMEYSPIDVATFRYNLTFRGQNYVVQSKNDLKFYNIKNIKVLDSNNKSSQDLITFTTINTKPSSIETFEWFGVAPNYVWRNTSNGSTHIPRGYATNITLKTRDTKWFNVNISWKSNFGLFNISNATGVTTEDRIASIVNNSTGNRYVSEAVIGLNSYFDDGTLSGLTSNVTIANNSGQISRIPGQIVIPFNNTTFGGNILDSTGNITYRQFSTSTGTGNVIIPGQLEIFHGNTVVYGYGSNGTSFNANSIGRLYLQDANISAQTGNIVYSQLTNNIYHRSVDASGIVSRDQLLVDYVNSREQLDIPLVWEVVDVYKYSDGYTDPRKVVVAPIDSDSDMVPDRPLQFTEYVDDGEFQIYEFYTDFDGYTYDRPTEGAILDLREETVIRVNFSEDTISPYSYAQVYTLSKIDWIFVKNIAIARAALENDLGKAAGIKVYAIDNDTVYINTPDSVNLNIVRLIETTEYFVRQGRGPTQNTLLPVKQDSIIRWQHVAPNDVRIDPSISNVVEMIVLTTSYYDAVQRYLKQPGATGFPLEPTSAEMSVEFQNLNEFKSASDTLVFRSAKFKLLFGAFADANYQARFRVVKLSNNISDNELKTRIISAINNYFDVNNWEFGETFYFTELSSYVHQQLGSAIGSFVILPRNTAGKFGDLFQVKAEPNELFASTATVNNIEIVEKISSQTLRTDR